MKNRAKRWISLSASLALLSSLLPVPVFASMKQEAILEPVDLIAQTPRIHEVVDEKSVITQKNPQEIVRATVVFQEEPAIDAYDLSQENADDPAIVEYRTLLEEAQEEAVSQIEEDVLAGGELEVHHNLTLAINAVSIETTRANLEKIARMDTVATVEIETEFLPQQDEEQIAKPTMITSPAIDGVESVREEGYTGAGRRIAIIDTGLNTDHISFDESAWQQQLDQSARSKGLDPAAYRSQLDLLEDSDIDAVRSVLHLSDSSVTGADLSVSEKIPYAWNYVDQNLDVSHRNDSQGDHGSHVAGISAANSLIPDGSGSFTDAQSAAKAAGAAPDAQVLVMKVFGRKGGAFSSDYFAAIEDAITLGCDAVNLSIGTSNSGYSDNETYREAFEKIKSSRTVVSISASNSGSWADKTALQGSLYKEDASFHNVGEPGSYSDALTVASMDNNKYTAPTVTIGNRMLFVSDAAYALPKLSSLTGQKQFVYYPEKVTGSENIFSAWNLSGKIVVVCCARTNADAVLTKLSEKDPAGIILLAENEDPLPTSLSGFEIPAALIHETHSHAFQTGSTDANGCFSGSLTLSPLTSTDIAGDHRNMSAFSSWGIPESLQMKPEITAPGGYIYSVDGMAPDNEAFRIRSGTSMAAPQIAGITALLNQRIEQDNLEAITGKSRRFIAQSLMMSTAVPMINNSTGQHWPVLQQGSGLVQADRAISAGAFLSMDESACHGALDGKIKAELGEDPDRTGQYSFGFTMMNALGLPRTYQTSGTFFTQKLSSDGQYLTKDTTPLEAALSVRVDGSERTSFRLASGQSSHIEVSISLSESQKALLTEQYPNGAYIQGFVTISPIIAGQDVEFSIPVLAWFGSWSEPSMFEPVSYYDQSHGFFRQSYSGIGGNLDQPVETNVLKIKAANGDETRFAAGNPYLEGDSRDRDRSAIQPGEKPKSVCYAPIRNAAISGIALYDESGAIIYHTGGKKHDRGTWINDAGVWEDNDKSMDLSIDSSLLQADHTYTVDLIAASSFYTQGLDLNAEDIVPTIASDSRIKSGARVRTVLHVDSQPPKITGAAVDTASSVLELEMSDNFNVAYLAVYNADQSEKLYECIPEDTTRGSTFTETIEDLTIHPGDRFVVVAGDYARNEYSTSLRIPSDTMYTVRLAGSGVRGEIPAAIGKHEEISMTLIAQDHYRLPETISITMGDVELAASSYSWNPSTGLLTIPDGVIEGDLVITVDSLPQQFTVSIVGTGLAAMEDVQVDYGQALDLEIEARNGYLLPEQIQILKGQSELLSSSQYTWNSKTGALHIKEGVIDQTIHITVNAIPAPKEMFTVRVHGQGIEPQEITVEENEELSFAVVAKRSFKLPQTIRITKAGGAIILQDSYRWDPKTGLLQISADVVVSDLDVTVDAKNGSLDFSQLQMAIEYGADLEQAAFLDRGWSTLAEELESARSLMDAADSQQDINDQAVRLSDALLVLRKRTEQPLP